MGRPFRGPRYVTVWFGREVPLCWGWVGDYCCRLPAGHDEPCLPKPADPYQPDEVNDANAARPR